MTSHELARTLLSMPDLPIVTYNNEEGPRYELVENVDIKESNPVTFSKTSKNIHYYAPIFYPLRSTNETVEVIRIE